MSQKENTGEPIELTPNTVEVQTMIPYESGPEFKEYEIRSEELPAFLRSMENKSHAEEVISVTIIPRE